MDKAHKQVVTTYPVALKYGQGRLHVPNPIPWHAQTEAVRCPNCETIFLLTSGFPKLQFFEALEKQHKNNEQHPDFIPSAPEWTRIEDCDCHY
jgi:hypothetical protein